MKKTNPLISIIVPVYNAEKYLDRCIKSIIQQTYTNIEIILIDDGSKDRSGEICDAFQKKDARIVVIHKTNGGQASARNVGLEVANGEYLGFVDDDDVIEPEMYETLYDNLREYKTKVSGIIADWIYPTYIKNDSVKFESRFYSSEELIVNMLGKKNLISSSVWDKLFNKELFSNIRFPDGCESEDYWVIANILQIVDGIYIQASPLYHWYQYDSSQSKKGFHERSKTYIEIAKSIRELYIKNGSNEKVIDAANNFVAISYIKFFGKIFQSKSYFEQRKLIKKYKRELRKELKTILCSQMTTLATKIKCVILSSLMCMAYGYMWEIKHRL